MLYSGSPATPPFLSCPLPIRSQLCDPMSSHRLRVSLTAREQLQVGHDEARIIFGIPVRMANDFGLIEDGAPIPPGPLCFIAELPADIFWLPTFLPQAGNRAHGWLNEAIQNLIGGHIYDIFQKRLIVEKTQHLGRRETSVQPHANHPIICAIPNLWFSGKTKIRGR